jgi:hypothetical protein
MDAFPPRPFYGRVSIHDECDDGIALLKELPGKRWNEIPPAFLEFNSGSLPLLEARALVAFLPAWLLRSMETMGDECVLAEFTMYFLSPGNEHEGQGEKRIVELVSSSMRPREASFRTSCVRSGRRKHSEHGTLTPSVDRSYGASKVDLYELARRGAVPHDA